MSTKRTVLEGDILHNGDLVPPAHDVTPGWIARNRHWLEHGRRLTHTAMIVAPPPARIVLGFVSIAADATLMIDEYGRKRGDKRRAAGDAAVLGLEGLALFAATKFAPARLAVSLGGIEAMRSALNKWRSG